MMWLKRLFPKEWVVIFIHDKGYNKVIDEFYFERSAKSYAGEMNHMALRMGYNHMYMVGRKQVVK